MQYKEPRRERERERATRSSTIYGSKQQLWGITFGLLYIYIYFTFCKDNNITTQMK